MNYRGELQKYEMYVNSCQLDGLMEETKPKIKRNPTPRSPFVVRIKRPKLSTPRRHKSLLNKRIENGENSSEFDSVADIDNSATPLRGRKYGAQKHAESEHARNSPQEQFNLDPLQDVLATISHQEHSISHFHQNRKLALAEECKKEVVEVRRKYNVLLQSEEALCNQRLKDLKELRYAVRKNQIYAELFSGSSTENSMPGNLEEVQGTSCSAKQHKTKWQCQRPRSSSSRIRDLIQELPNLSVSKVPVMPSPLSSVPVQPVHTSPPRMDLPLSSVIHSPQGQKGKLMHKLPKKDIFKMPISHPPSGSAQPFPFPPPSSVVHLPSMLPSASNSQRMSQNNLTSQDDQDQPMLRPLTIHKSSMAPPPIMPTASNVYFRAPAPHLRRYKPE